MTVNFLAHTESEVQLSESESDRAQGPNCPFFTARVSIGFAGFEFPVSIKTKDLITYSSSFIQNYVVRRN